MRVHELLTSELGDLSPESRQLADTSFETLLRELGCADHDVRALRDPGPLSPRERILGYLEQMAPGLRDSVAGPETERFINALAMHVHADARISTV